MQPSKLYSLNNCNPQNVEAVDAIPFAFLFKPAYGLFYYPDDKEDWSNLFAYNIKKANIFKFTNNI
jgi:hypothetical protein